MHQTKQVTDTLAILPFLKGCRFQPVSADRTLSFTCTEASRLIHTTPPERRAGCLHKIIFPMLNTHTNTRERPLRALNKQSLCT